MKASSSQFRCFSLACSFVFYFTGFFPSPFHVLFHVCPSLYHLPVHPALHLNLGPSNSGQSRCCRYDMLLYVPVPSTFPQLQCSAVQAVSPTGATTSTTLSSPFVHSVIHSSIHPVIPSELVPSAKVVDTAELALRSMQCVVFFVVVVFGVWSD